MIEYLKKAKAVIVLFGAIYGDVIGSYYELRYTKDYNFEFKRIGSSFTDDTVLIAAVCQTVLDEPDEITKWDIRSRAKEFAAHYRQYYSRYPYAGFGSMFSAWAKDYSAPDSDSYGNGAAMRVIPLGYAYATMEQTMLQVEASCIPSHNNKEAITGAKAVAAAVFLARNGESKEVIKTYVEKTFGYDLSASVSLLRQTHTFSSRTSYSVPPAIIAFLDSSDYESAIRGAVSLGGDADTEACIAGGIAEAYYKAIPEHIIRFCDPLIDYPIKRVVKEFGKRYIVR